MKKIVLFCLIGAHMFATQNNDQQSFKVGQHEQETIAEWHNFFTTSHWHDLIKGVSPVNSLCGIVYELPNFLNRPNEGLAVVDMSTVAFAEPHYHPNLEIYFILQGKALVVVGTQQYLVQQGDVVVIPPYKAHYTIPHDDYVIACVNIPAYTPESYIPLHESNAAVEFDYAVFKQHTEHKKNA